MENTIKLNYNIEFDSFKNEGSITILTDKNSTYYFVPCIRPHEDLKELYFVSAELNRNRVASHSFILNRNNQILTNINNIEYLLLKINCIESYEFNLYDMNVLNKMTRLNDDKTKLYRNNWGELWSSKIDYFEYQISELGKGKRIIQNSFSYYVGLAENAIAYVNQLQKIYQNEINTNICLSRKRVYYPNYAINYLNPLNFIFDLAVRDIAEYIKAMYFKDIDVWKEIDSLFKRERFTSYELHMFYARLLYPSYYFDLYDNVMNKKDDEEAMIEIISKASDYEYFLIEIYDYLNNFTPMIPIDWLIEKGT